MTETPITELDFEAVKESLKAFLRSQDRFKDYDFEGSNMAALINVLAYNTWQNNFFTNMAQTEMYLDSAQLRSSVVSHAKTLNYVPRSRVSASASLNVTLTPADRPGFVTIPARTAFTATAPGKTLTFYNDKSFTVEGVNGAYVARGLKVYEGRYVTELHAATKAGKYTVASQNVDASSVRVFVKENGREVEYKKATTVFGLTDQSKVFFVQAKDDAYEVIFGDDVFGLEPPLGAEVKVIYRVTGGPEGNGVSSFNTTAVVGQYTAAVALAVRSAGGANAETIDSIRYYAPRSIQIQDRAVTESDYEILLKNRFPEVQAVAVYGGEEKNPPRYGRVIVAVDVVGSNGVSENNKRKYADFLRERSPLGIEPVVESPEFMFIGVDTTVYLDTSRAEIGEGELRDLVMNKIVGYGNKNLADFKTTLRSSKLSTAIDQASPAILSNDLDVEMIIPFNPTLNAKVTMSSTFGNELAKDQLGKTESLQEHKPAFRSSAFTFGKVSAFLQDDGKGVVQVVRQTGTTYTVLSPNVGTVNYETGAFSVRNLTVAKYSGSEIRLYGRARTQTINPPKSRITTIRKNDVSITVKNV